MKKTTLLNILLFCLLSTCCFVSIFCMEITPHIQWPSELVEQIAKDLDFRTKISFINTNTTYHATLNNKPFLFNSLTIDDYTFCMVNYAKQNNIPMFEYLIENENATNRAFRKLALKYLSIIDDKSPDDIYINNSKLALKCRCIIDDKSPDDLSINDSMKIYAGCFNSNPRTKNQIDISKMLLHATFHMLPPVILLCLELGANVNIREEHNDQYTPLDFALHSNVRNNHIIMRLLTHKNANINSRDVIGGTPLHAAATSGNIAIVKWLLKNKNLNSTLAKTTYTCYTAIHDACKNKHPKILKLLLTCENSNINDQTHYWVGHETALHCAVEKNCEESVKILLACDGIDTTIKNKNGETAYEIAIRNRYAEIAKILYDHQEKTIS